MKLIEHLIILVIKFYKYFISPHLMPSCRFQPTCSEYFLECLKVNGVIKGSFYGLKRILKCHPIKILGGQSGLDPVPNLNKEKK